MLTPLKQNCFRLITMEEVYCLQSAVLMLTSREATFCALLGAMFTTDMKCNNYTELIARFAAKKEGSLYSTRHFVASETLARL